jgi:hypothetical protein
VVAALLLVVWQLAVWRLLSRPPRPGEDARGGSPAVSEAGAEDGGGEP